MPTPFQDLYTAIKSMMTDIDTAAAAWSSNVTQAPSNYGLDFRIVPGDAMYQIQIKPSEDWRNSNVNYPRAEVSVAIHHYVSSLANEEAFLHQTMDEVADSLLDGATWKAAAGVHDLEPDTEPEISDGAREGNVITFEITASVLMDPV
jgi:hypothetical protein